MPSPEKKRAWALDQVLRSEFFHQKLHEWGVLELAYRIEQVKGERLTWDLQALGISERAWNKVIHRGIKPVIVFAHPQVLTTIPQAVGYYRMLAIVSQKSMNNVGLSTKSCETGAKLPDQQKAEEYASLLNTLISRLIEADTNTDAREFDLWRAMAAGDQAGGSWRNAKGDKIELIVKGAVLKRIREQGLIIEESPNRQQFSLMGGRKIVLASEPDIAVYNDQNQIAAAIEIKGGIDRAGVLERVGAAIEVIQTFAIRER